jgi:3',5'-cyclic AMP phosphodiesterase CpdA
MPFTLATCNRRGFGRNLLAAGLSAAGIGGSDWGDANIAATAESANPLGASQLAAAEPSAKPAEGKPIDADRWTLLSDLHIAADLKTEKNGYRPGEQLTMVVEQLLDGSTRPAHVLVNGDCAWRTGEPGDYAGLVRRLGRLTHAGMPVHLTLGNHDRRDAFRTGLAEIRRATSAIETHEVRVIEGPRADFILLDSLEETNALPGRLGRAQLDWLAGALDRRRDKPAILAVHHPPEFLPLPEPMGIIDTWPLLEVIRPRRRVKAVVFGHLHNWTHSRVEGIHYIGLPATAYPFSPDRPVGWVEALLRDAGMTLELRCLDRRHPQQGEKAEFDWRSDRA